MPAGFSLQVRLGPRSHPILIGRGCLPHWLRHSPILDKPNVRIFVISDARLKPLAKRLIRLLSHRCAGSLFLRGGESTKDMKTLPPLYLAAARARLDRQSIVLAIGGGVIGDVAGFFAATYLRGIRIIHVPTTLIAQVDSAIGGKTGVNLPGGKNLVGAFHQPSMVWVDPTTLTTLPERQFRSGLAEVIKYGIIADKELFERLEAKMDRVLRRDSGELSWIIRRCCAIKARVVSRDERETTGIRAILNFGHTIGHGIEAAARYSLLHGEAVALGMIGAIHLSKKYSGLLPSSAQRIHDLIHRAGLPVRLKSHLPSRQIMAAMKLDKKVSEGKIRFVLARRIGSVAIGIPVEADAIQQALETLS